MTILVSGIEVGSVRALIPVCLELIRNGNKILIEKKGHFEVELVKELSSVLIAIPENKKDLEDFLIDKKISKVLFSVNVHDTRPLIIARIAQKLDIKTFHLLDYWHDYKARMERDGKKIFLPTIYFVPDDFAFKKAVEEGIPSEIIKVSGQPALENINSKYNDASLQEDPFIDLKSKNRKIILFVSEPVTQDQGGSYKENSNYRGYTEFSVLKILINALNILDKKITIIILPHPRQDNDNLINFWELEGGKKFGDVYLNLNSRNTLPFVDGVIGMASTLLFEAFLVGKTVLSIQPDLRNNPFEMLENRNGFELIKKYNNADQKVVKWFTNLNIPLQSNLKEENGVYKNSSKRIVNEILKI